MTDPVLGGPRRRMRWALWLNAVLWTLFALGMAAVAATSQEAREHAVFLQVLAGCIAAATGSVAAARYRRWGVWLALAGAAGVLAAWILGDSGSSYRKFVAADIVLFAIAVAIDRRAFGFGERHTAA